MSGLSSTGFTRKRLSEIIEDIETALKFAFGENIDLSAESRFSQFTAILSEQISDQWESQENSYNSQYPSTSSDSSLSNVVMYNGIERAGETYSTVDSLQLSGIEGTTIGAGSEVSVDTTGYIFTTDTLATIGVGGTAIVSATAVLPNPIEAVAGTLTVIDSPTYGWTSVTNLDDASVGSAEETDAELRIRREKSVALASQNNADGLIASLLGLDNVISADVIDNKTNTTDSYGVPAHSFESIVEGGSSSDIGLTVWENNPQGIQSYGDILVVIEDGQGVSQTVYYSEPTDIPIYFKIDITVDVDIFPSTGEDDIKTSVVTYGEDTFSISSDVIWNKFFAPINETDGILTIDLYIGTSTSPTSQDNITISRTELSTYDISRVEVNIV